MKNFRFVLEIPANSEQEAKAKLDLMLQWVAFPKGRDIGSLAGSYLLYLAWNRLGQSWAAYPLAKGKKADPLPDKQPNSPK